jgi:hypothetical protein
MVQQRAEVAARYWWSMTGTRLRFTFAGGGPTPRFTKFLTAA